MLVGTGQHFEHAPGAGAQIDQRVHLALAQRPQHGLLHRLFGHMQRAQQIPAGGDLGEIFGGEELLLGANGLLALDIALAGGIGAIEPADQPLRERCPIALLGQAIIGPGPFGIALDQPGIGQKLEMPRDARLALLEDFGEVLDRVVALGQQGKQPQAGVFTRGLQHAHQFCQISQSNRPKSDIKMSLYPVEAKVQRRCGMVALIVPITARRPVRHGH